MGLDVNLYAEVDPTPVELEQAEKFFTARTSFGDAWDNSPSVLAVEEADWRERPRVVVQTWARYYGQGYKRGDWPTIYGAIRTLQAAFPESRVFYGGDSTDDGIECDEGYLTEIWMHFLGPHGDDYRRPRSAE